MKNKFNCPAELTLSLFGGKWKVIILWLLRNGGQRSGRLKSRLPGITSAAFSNAVRDLENSGLLRRRSKAGLNLIVSYELTTKGESLRPIVKSLVKWGLQNQDGYLDGEFGMAFFYKS
jgi:DNA-binding HxlR family transcriptional regulator